jgi:hypothetical protein
METSTNGTEEGAVSTSAKRSLRIALIPALGAAGDGRGQPVAAAKPATYLGTLHGQNGIRGEFDDTVVLSGPAFAVDAPRIVELWRGRAGRGTVTN